MRNKIRDALIAAAALAAAGCAQAVAAPPPGASQVAASPASASTAAVRADPNRRAAAVEKRLANLHKSLRITAEQEAKWNDFAKVMRANAEEMDANYQRRAEALPTMTAADNVRSYAATADAHAKEAESIVPAFQALYDSMPDAQKLLADKVFRNDRRSSRG